MAVVLRNIALLDVEDWLSFDPINADDLGEVIEVAQAEYARLGQAVPLWTGQISTDSTTFTTTSTSGPGLEELANGGTARRVLDGGAREVALMTWGVEIEVEATVERRNTDGTTATIAQNTIGAGRRWQPLELCFALSEADVCDQGNAANDEVPIRMTFRHRHEPFQRPEGTWAHPFQLECPVAAGVLP
jgi:hypothetical protein